ncbi:MAG TPA: FHIPEP family type III secretion protein, partial [Xanthobacteraceae bacterium]|nr:FHIPEP family type III secretion protein [Xanthobacteraceae bacterium]
LAINPGRGHGRLDGIAARDPDFGLEAVWIEPGLREHAQTLDYTVVDAATVVSTHLAEILKANMADLLSYAEVQKLLKELPKEQAELLKDIVPSQITASGIQRVLQLLLSERVSIRDLGTILEGIAEAVPGSRHASQIVEMVRVRLARQLCAQHTSPAGYLPLISLSPKWETAFAESIVGQGEERALAMQPSKLTEFVNAVRERFEDAARQNEAPVLLSSASARPFVRQIVERFRPQTAVMSQAEIHPRVRLKTVGSV